MQEITVILSSLNLLLLLGLFWRRPRRIVRKESGNVITLDSSAIIDGRILEVARAGFLPRQIIVPQFILDEVQQIADSQDPLKRERGRFGLSVVKELEQLPGYHLKVERTVPSNLEVDDLLVEFTKSINGRVVSNDFALLQIAQLKGVGVLNVNALAQGLRTSALPGEQIELKIIQPGSDPKQGVGYLDDGTMVVIEKAQHLIGQRVTAVVSRVFQTSAGKMLFAELPKRKITRGH